MKTDIFISYSDFDKDKVKLIENELKENKFFQPLIIASNREALKPLVKKVAEGIIKSQVIIPILTKRSLQTQWINQEIGYAIALGKNIKPIIENEIIDDLKGFIHKQIDIPYCYTANSDKLKEKKSFLECFRKILLDLETEQNDIEKKESTHKKNPFEESFEKAEKFNQELEFRQRRVKYLASKDAKDRSKFEVQSMISYAKEIVNKLKQKNIYCEFEESQTEPTLIIRSSGISVSIAWKDYPRSIQFESLLFIKYWDGNLIENKSIQFSRTSDAEPIIISDLRYAFDIDKSGATFWLNINDNKSYSYSIVIENTMNWFVERIEEKKLILK